MDVKVILKSGRELVFDNRWNLEIAVFDSKTGALLQHKPLKDALGILFSHILSSCIIYTLKKAVGEDGSPYENRTCLSSYVSESHHIPGNAIEDIVFIMKTAGY